MKKMLFITAVPPSNKGGGELVTLNAIKTLSAEFQIDLIYFDYPDHENMAKDYVQTCKVFLPSTINCIKKPFFFPLFTRRFTRKIKNYIQSQADKYDILFFDFSQTAIYSLFVKHSNKVVRCHDIIFQKYARKHKIILPWVRCTERRILKSANKVFTLNFKDTEILKTEYNIEAEDTSDVLNLVDYRIDENTFVEDSFIFFGFWGRAENTDGLVWFFQNVYPMVNKNKKFVIMGGGLNTEIINYLNQLGVKYLGFVEDCYSEISKHTAMIVPLFQGAGIKIKVLDAYSTGTPVIGTALAFEGIPNITDLEYLANNPEEFAKYINNFQIMTIERKINNKNKFNSIKHGSMLVDLLK